jgi:stearoyl-CoA desaturase (delta-9 desaturase)
LHNNQYVILYGFSILLIGLDSVFSTRFFGSYILAVIFSSHLNYLVNTVCHLKHFGYRSFETKDNSRNIWTLSFFTAGLSLHNNHHKDPGNPNFAKKWYEIDLSYLVICLLRKK